MQAIVSIHDVSPATLVRVQSLIGQLPSPCHQGLTLLIIPGLHWTAEQIKILHDWQARGYHLAGHGWKHHCHRIHGWYHKLHSAVLSRDAAEHLSLNKEQLIELVSANYRWFELQGLRPPQVYVPPAWAMGNLSNADLQQLPFRFYETTAGVYDSECNQRKVLPLVGFEADNTLRMLSLGGWNWLNCLAANRNRPLRISIHPQDDRLRLGKQMHACLRKVTQAGSYPALFESADF